MDIDKKFEQASILKQKIDAFTNQINEINAGKTQIVARKPVAGFGNSSNIPLLDNESMLEMVKKYTVERLAQLRAEFENLMK